MSKKHAESADPPRLFCQRDNNARAGEGQCDCACVTAMPTERQPASPPTNVFYSIDDSFWTVPLEDNYHATLSRQDSKPVVLNHSALTIADHFTQARLLVDAPSVWHEAWRDEDIQSTLEQMVMLGLLVPEGCVAPPLTETLITLSGWLHITDRCNLRCAYCYLPHAPVDMSVETGRAAIDSTFRSALTHDFRQVKLKYAGGEAVLRFPLIIELHRYAQTLADRCDLALDGVVLSNGTLLTAEIVQTMQSVGLRLMISLDGLGESHDGQRPYAGGRGSSAAVTQAVDVALAYGLVPEISITISRRNVDGLPDLMAWLLERDLPFRLNFYRENDRSACTADLQLEEERIIDGMLAAYQVIEANPPRRSLLASLVDFANLSAPHLRTCSVGHAYLVFDCRGRIAKCQMQIDKPVTTVDAADPLTLIQADQVGIRNVPIDEKEGCRSCEWKHWCTGGCPLATFRATGRYDVKSPNCNIYKALYPEAIRLEGLRLLKYADEI